MGFEAKDKKDKFFYRYNQILDFEKYTKLLKCYDTIQTQDHVFQVDETFRIYDFVPTRDPSVLPPGKEFASVDKYVQIRRK